MRGPGSETRADAALTGRGPTCFFERWTRAEKFEARRVNFFGCFFSAAPSVFARGKRAPNGELLPPSSTATSTSAVDVLGAVGSSGAPDRARSALRARWARKARIATPTPMATETPTARPGGLSRMAFGPLIRMNAAEMATASVTKIGCTCFERTPGSATEWTTRVMKMCTRPAATHPITGDATHAITVLTSDAAPSEPPPFVTRPTAMSPPMTECDAEIGRPYSVASSVVKPVPRRTHAIATANVIEPWHPSAAYSSGSITPMFRAAGGCMGAKRQCGSSGANEGQPQR